MFVAVVWTASPPSPSSSAIRGHGANGLTARGCDRPVGPTHEPVDRVSLVRLAEWELVALAVEPVAAVAQTVRPRDQRLAAGAGAHLAGGVAVEQSRLPARCPPWTSSACVPDGSTGRGEGASVTAPGPKTQRWTLRQRQGPWWRSWRR